MQDFKLSNAVTALQNCSAAINSLWTAYIIANFAFSGYGLAVPTLSHFMATCLTIGYLLFTSGHLVLVRQALNAAYQLGQDIAKVAESEPLDAPYRESILALARTANRWQYSIVAHVVIDVCIVSMIWYRALP